MGRRGPRALRFRVLGLAWLTACAGRSSQWDADPPTERPKVTVAEREAVAARIQAGNSAWGKRSDRKHLELAISAWSSAAEALVEPDPDLLVRLTRAHFVLADGFLRDDRESYLRTLDAGVEWGESAMIAASPEFDRSMREGAKFRDAVALAPKAAVPAMFWYASVLGRWAQEKGLAVMLGQQDNVKATMDRCLELDSEFFYGGPHRYFGVYYAVAPEFIGGDLEKSKIHFKKALEIAPLYAGTKVLWASELAVRAKDQATFERLLTEVTFMDANAIPDLQPETVIEKERARDLLARTDSLF